MTSMLLLMVWRTRRLMRCQQTIRAKAQICSSRWSKLLPCLLANGSSPTALCPSSNRAENSLESSRSSQRYILLALSVENEE